MASRKKQRGKLRRAAKAEAAKAEAEAKQAAEAEEEPPVILEQEEEVEGDLSGDVIRQQPDHLNAPHPPSVITDAFWTQPREEPRDILFIGKRAYERLRQIKTRESDGSSSSCCHFIDFELPRTNIPEFVAAFRAEYCRRYDDGGDDCEQAITITSLLMEVSPDMWGHFVTVWKYPKRVLQIIMHCVNVGTDCVINKYSPGSARFYASFASYFGQFLLQQSPSGSTVYWGRAADFSCADDDTVIGFFREYTLCSCLDSLSNLEKEVEAESAYSDEFAWLDSIVQHHESVQETLDEEKYALLDINNQLSESDIDTLVKQPRSEEVVLKLELSRLYEQLEEAGMLMRNTGIGDYARLNFALDQLSQPSLLLNLNEEFEVHWPNETEESRKYPHAKNECTHSHEVYRGPALHFAQQFVEACNSGDRTLGRTLETAHNATSEMVRCSSFWTSPLMMKIATSLILGVGAQEYITGNYKASRQCAAIAYCFEQHVSANLCEQGKCKRMNWPKINELFYDPDEHTLVSFFKKRIPCSCLDKKYKQVKSVKKLGICYNMNCPHPGRKVERSTTKCCSRCHLANYCSRECQVENWFVHKKFCQQSYQMSILDSCRGVQKPLCFTFHAVSKNDHA